jgi:DNA-binding NarL/FixJ family response regulator
MVIHSGKSVVQIARELGCSEASLQLGKRHVASYLEKLSVRQVNSSTINQLLGTIQGVTFPVRSKVSIAP